MKTSKKTEKTVSSIISEVYESLALREFGGKKNFEIIYVPFVEIPSNLQKMYNEELLTPEEYAARLEPYYRTAYGVGANEDEAILSLGDDFEDKNEVVRTKERFGIGA